MNIGAVLGVAGLAAALTRPLTDAGKKSSSSKKLKKAKKRCQQDLAACETEAERCLEQRAECFSIFVVSCEGDPACLAEGRRCCGPLAACNVVPFLRCLA